VDARVCESCAPDSAWSERRTGVGVWGLLSRVSNPWIGAVSAPGRSNAERAV